LIVVDTSALIAILLDEPERRTFIDIIVDYGDPCVSAATYLEASMVMEAYSGIHGGRDIDDLIEDVGIRIVPVRPRLGLRGRHSAALAKVVIGRR
jgi:ribonuclease VapC